MRWYFKISGDFKDFDVDRLSGWIFVLDFFDFGFDQKQKSLKRALGKRGKEFAKNQNLDLLKVQAKSKKVRLIVIKKLHLDHEKPVLIDHQTYTNIFKTPPIYWKWVLDQENGSLIFWNAPLPLILKSHLDQKANHDLDL